MGDNLNEQAPPASSAETTDRGYFDFLWKKKPEEEDQKPSEEEQSTLPTDFDHHKVQLSEPVSEPVEPVKVNKVEEEEDEEVKKQGGLLEKLHRPHSSSFSFKPEGDQKPEEEHSTLAAEFHHKVQVSEPVEPVDVESKEEEEAEEKKHGSLLEKLHRSDTSSSSSSDEEGDDEDKKKRRKERKEKKGLKEKLKEKLPGHKDQDTNVPIDLCDDKEKPHVQDEVVYSEPSHPPPVQEVVYSEPSHLPPVQEVVYSEPSHLPQPTPPQQEEDLEKKGFIDKIKDKLPGQKKVDEHHVAAEPCLQGEGKEKRSFMDKIKDKIHGHSSKTGEEKKEHEEK